MASMGEWAPIVYVCGGFIIAVLFLYLLAVVSGVHGDD